MAISGIGNSYNLFEVAANYVQRKTTVREAISMPEEQSVNLSISDEGLRALREREKEYEPESDDIDFGKLHPVETNEIEFDYYMKMMHLSSLTLGEGGNYDVKDVMNSIMETYETLYNEIVDAHKYGDRLISYEIMGDKMLTLEEDLEKLDKAFERRLGDLEGYITCQQTNKAFANPDYEWYFRRINNTIDFQSTQRKSKAAKHDDYNYLDDEYIDTAVAMMKLARENFLTLFDSKNYQKGDGRFIISDMINKNDDFMTKTKKLFS
ncbi:MAG: hypothetical protein HDR30_01335 [Lachnospiraceae bacterium]|nr:hypothetical protein [Lachnospiraceae bacterium]